MSKAWPVPKADRSVIKKVARSNVELTLAKLDPFIRQSRWLAKSSRYAKNTVQRLDRDSKKTLPLNGKHLAQYISASGILHCSDGWSYLGRAINCLLKGDPHRVVHLAYYAELRAGLSLLASEGIGVFKNIHFVIDGPNVAQKLPAKQVTHAAAWSYLKYWSSLRRSGDLFSEIVTPGGTTLSEWFSPLGGIENHVQPQARFLLNQWSMDLGLFAEDRDARNDSSYRPDGIPGPWYLSASDTLTLATELWEACEPSQSSLFDGIDRHILRMTAESAFKGRFGLSPSQDLDRFAAFVESVVNPLSFDSPVAEEWKRFLLRRTVPHNPRIFSYSNEDPLDKEIGHAAVLARATLLLRLATGSALKLIKAAGISGDQLEFWWSRLGINRGVWDGAKSRADLLDLWQDISVLFDDIRDFQSSTPAAQQTFQLIGSRLPQVVAGLGGCERVAIWSLTR